MTDAAHANNLRAYIVGDCDYDIHVEAAIERAIELLEREARYVAKIDEATATLAAAFDAEGITDG